MAEQISDPQPVIVVSSTGTGDGQVIRTPAGMPDLVTKVITPLASIIIKALKTFFQTLSANLLTAGFSASGASETVSNALPVKDFSHALTVCAVVAGIAALMSVITNLGVLFSDLSDKFPLMKA